MDSPEQASDTFPALEGAAHGVLREACALLGDGIPTEGPPKANNVVGEAPSIEIVVGPLILARQFNLTIGRPYRPRNPNMLVLNSPVKPMKWDHPPTDASVPGLDATQSIIDHWNPFNQKDASVADMRELYPTNHQISVVALSKEYFIPFLGYLDKKSY